MPPPPPSIKQSVASRSHTLSSKSLGQKNQRKKFSFRIPLRFQITLLLAFFVGLVAAVSFRSTISFLERDKVSTVRELQILQVDQLARDVSERISRATNEVREAGFHLLDPSLGELKLKPKPWNWVRVNTAVWKSPDLASETLPPPPSDPDGAPQVDSEKGHPDRLIVRERILVHGVDAAGQPTEQRTLVEGSIQKSSILVESTDLERGPVHGVLVNLSGLKSSTAPDRALREQIWLATPESRDAFMNFYAQLTPDWQTELARPAPTTSRSVRVGGRDNFIAWSSLNVKGANVAILSFVDKQALLFAFKRFLAEQGFWAFLLLGFGVIAAGFLGRGLSRPIERLVEATRILETGDFRVRVKDIRKDELGDLASAFNHMGQALEEREDALKNAQAAIVQNEKLAALGTLSAGIAHEVKNPLAGILGNADMALSQLKKFGPEMSAVTRYVEIIQKETKRCRGIVDSLMRFARQEKASFEPVDLELITWEGIHLMEHPLNLARVRIEKKFAEDVKMVNGNSNQIEQVLLNMLQNAGHAMPEGGVIEVGTENISDPDNAHVGRLVAFCSEEFQGPFSRLMIRDHGVGMTLEVQRKIFEPFFTTKPKGVGTGLGLSVTMGILGDHKARISLDSAPGEGTAFFMDFMAVQNRTPEVVHQLDEIRHRKGGGSAVATDVGRFSGGGNTHGGMELPNVPDIAADEIHMPDLAPPPGTPSLKASLGPRAVGPEGATPKGAAKFAIRKPTAKKDG